jgi:hypothetical protein
MKKISNSVKVEIGSKNKDRKKEVKASLNAIEKLSE